MKTHVLDHLRFLEAESIHILRETVAEFANPVMLYSIGKDSQVLLHLARKAFHPAPLPFPLLHIDTTWKFRDMYAFRDRFTAQHGFRLIVRQNRKALAEGMNPFDHTSQKYTHAMKTQPLLEALALHGFDAAFGGARRDEEKSRAKERVFSFRDRHGQWEPRRQRPELWNLYNGRHAPGEHVRVFPISNWTELDVWRYIQREGVELPSIYYAHERDVFRRDGMWLAEGPWGGPRGAEELVHKTVRYRTVGDGSCTGAVESAAGTVEEIISEVMASRLTERGATRADDRLSEAAMEDRKREGYF